MDRNELIYRICGGLFWLSVFTVSCATGNCGCTTDYVKMALGHDQAPSGQKASE